MKSWPSGFVYHAMYCVDCADGFHGTQTNNGGILSSCSPSYGGSEAGDYCIPPLPSSCRLPKMKHGGCGVHITQYQPSPMDAEGMNDGS